MKKSKALLGGGLGLLIGGVGGGVTAQLTMSEKTKMEGQPNIITFASSVLGAVIGALLGISIGAAAGKDTRIPIYEMSPEEIEMTLEKLRKKAMIPDFQ